ncbi:MAG: ATP-binding cassette domain-containing protein, partial [Candidatus Dependentiae bacterium]|nr:ATP-binding cassette domain-containing protein [Candidatus Dependentiae bacterium]
ANGVGKTTLINCITGKYIPLTGKVTLGHGVKVAFFEQDQAQALNPDHTIFEEVQLGCPQVSDAEIRTVLGSFQFSGDDVYKKIKVLSGGEKNRVAMTKVLLQRANFLILDEPTNHLDLYAKDVLCQALQSYEGTILFVSHDLDFVNKVATGIIELTPTSSYRYLGTYQEFCASQKIAQTQIRNAAIPPTKTTKHALSSDSLKIIHKQITELERTISKLEQNETKYSEALGAHPYGSKEYNTFLTRLNQTKQSLTQANKDWEEAMQKLEQAQQ